MPTYSYECQDCGHTYDAFQAMKDDPHTVCPECKGRVARLIGAGAGIVFKGSGFYVTDYKKSGSGGSAPSSASGSSGTSAGSSSSGNSGSSGTSGTSGSSASSSGSGT